MAANGIRPGCTPTTYGEAGGIAYGCGGTACGGTGNACCTAYGCAGGAAYGRGCAAAGADDATAYGCCVDDASLITSAVTASTANTQRIDVSAMSSSSSSDDDATSTEDEETDEDEEEPVVEEVSASHVDEDVAVLREMCAAMDATFARLLLRYPRGASQGATCIERGRRGGAGSRPPDDDEPLPPRPRDNGPPRLARFHDLAGRMTKRSGNAPESEPPESNEDLAERAVAALARPDVADDHVSIPAWNPDNPEDVAAALRQLEAADDAHRYLKAAAALKLVDHDIREKTPPAKLHVDPCRSVRTAW